MPELDRYHPAVMGLAALAEVDARTALAWLQQKGVRPSSRRRLEEALPRARQTMPEHAEVYASRAA